MTKRNNEITIKINVSDDMLATIANILVLSGSTMIPAGLSLPKPAPPLPPSSPIGFRSKGDK